MNQKRIYQTLHALTGAAMLSIASTAVAQTPPPNGPMPFASYDKNGDGFISEAEFDAARSQRMQENAAQGRPMRGIATAPSFASLDTNHDGKLNLEELLAGQRAQQAQRGPRGGGGGGGGRGWNAPSFAEFDLDHDQAITASEFEQARNQRIAERAKAGYPMRNLGNAPRFEDIDTDHDGKLTATEFAAHQMQWRQRGGPTP